MAKTTGRSPDGTFYPNCSKSSKTYEYPRAPFPLLSSPTLAQDKANVMVFTGSMSELLLASRLKQVRCILITGSVQQRDPSLDLDRLLRVLPLALLVIFAGGCAKLAKETHRLLPRSSPVMVLPFSEDIARIENLRHMTHTEEAGDDQQALAGHEK
eukprot:2642147-Amphidinium_carterae.1